MIEGAPLHELTRSPAAMRVGELAARSGLLLSHFEHRRTLPWLPAWVPADRPDLGEPSGWAAGTLPEPKFRSFRLERRIGSFHPAHRAKWTAHELCHGLVGFAWKPGAPLLWHATAARLSELLPVALWYFHDEAGLRRCPAHQGGGPLFGLHCLPCEEAATQGPVEDPHMDQWMARGRAFIHAEIAAARATLRTGSPVRNRHATLELCSDGLAYVAAHGSRICSDTFSAYIARFPNGGHTTIEGLINRIESVSLHMEGEAEADPLDGDRWTWISQDLGWRLLWFRAQIDGDSAAWVDGLLDKLDGTEAGVASVVDPLMAAQEDGEDVPTGALLAVGYALPEGQGRSAAQVAEGLASCLPRTLALMHAHAPELIADFTAQDQPQRMGIGLRFAEFLDHDDPDPIVDQAALEAAVAHAPTPDAAELSLGADAAEGAQLELAAGVLLVPIAHAVGLEDEVEWPEPLQEPMGLAVKRAADGEVDIAALDGPTLQALAGDLDGLEADIAAELLALGILVPTAWST